MTKLYEKINHGDRKTIVRKYKRGAKILLPGPTTVELKADVSLKVTQEYNGYAQTWFDVLVHLHSTVEQAETSPTPEPDAPPPGVVPSLFARIRSRFFR